MLSLDFLLFHFHSLIKCYMSYKSTISIWKAKISTAFIIWLMLLKTINPIFDSY